MDTVFSVCLGTVQTVAVERGIRTHHIVLGRYCNSLLSRVHVIVNFILQVVGRIGIKVVEYSHNCMFY